MKYLWLFLLPLLFLPNSVFELRTAYGILTVSDLLIWPYAILVYRSSRCKEKQLVDCLTPWMLGFVWYATLSTLSIAFRYDYASNHQLVFSLLKIGKLSLYGLAGVLTVKALADERLRFPFFGSLLAAGCLMGATLFVSRYSSGPSFLSPQTLSAEYQDNPVGAVLSLLICYCTGFLLQYRGRLVWRWSAGLALVAMVFGLLLSNGRGGWIAAMAGLGYLFFRLGFRRALLVGLVGIALVVIAYYQLPAFRKQADKTFWPDQAYQEHMARYQAGIAGFDDGARLRYWKKEAEKLIDAPVLGTGFFHRAGETRLDRVGSHNFFLQMFLETGLIGGLLVLLILLRMWRQAGMETARLAGWEVPVKAALLAAFVAGLSGEYFYGGMVLFTLLLTYGSIGSLFIPVSRKSPSLLPVCGNHTNAKHAIN